MAKTGTNAAQILAVESGGRPSVQVWGTRGMVSSMHPAATDAALGSPGGFGIVQYVIQTIVNMVDYGLDIRSAIEAPRFKLEDLAGRVGIEKRVSAAVRKRLAELGHDIIEYPEWTDRVGGVEGVFVDADTGNMLGGYDPRRNSLAAGFDRS